MDKDSDNNIDDQKDKENIDQNGDNRMHNGHCNQNNKKNPQFPDISVLPHPISGNNTSFNFGKRWRYSKKYQNNENNDKMNTGKYNQWFVPQKYPNLKREILSNSIKKIPMVQWNHINTKAKQFMNCTKIKSLTSCKSIKYEFESMTNIKENQSISLDHIICILIYCNFTEIKNHFTETFERVNKFEQWKDVKLKHSEYANFGRILTETIECFGDCSYQTQSDVDNDDDDNNIFYHAMVGSYSLHSIHARFFVPTSMTKELSVITYYCYNTIKIDRYNNGLIIGLTSNNTDLRYFNCSFLSDFTNESEVIFRR